MSSRCPCTSKKDKFCYVCGNFETENNRRSINETIKQKFLECYGTAITNLDKSWVPTIICSSCRNTLNRWNDIKNDVIVQPAIWREPLNHDKDCYFCAYDVTGINKKKVKKGKNPSVDSVTPPKKGKIDRSQQKVSEPRSLEQIDVIESEHSSDTEYFSDDGKPILYNQDDLDDLIRDLGLAKDSAELLASRLKERNLLLPGTKITAYRNREQNFVKYFTSEDTLVYCHDIKGLVNEYKTASYSYKPDDWRLFIDSSTESLKAVLLHNGNEYAAIPIAHSSTLKESYETFRLLLEKVNYNLHQWLICGDFKMINILLGLQPGNIKYPCYICLWDSRSRDQHYSKKEWEKRSKWEVGSENVVCESLVNRSKILLPPLHIKLGLIKQFVKALDIDGACFQYIKSKFSHLSDAKIKEGVFVGPDIRALMKDEDFVKCMKIDEKNAWLSFKKVTENFLGNHRDPKYATIVTKMLKDFQKLGCLMSMKLHFLFSHLENFPENVGAFSEEMGERFHQDIKQQERRYQGKLTVRMMADYAWSLKRNNNSPHHRRKSLKRSFEWSRERFHKKK